MNYTQIAIFETSDENKEQEWKLDNMVNKFLSENRNDIIVKDIKLSVRTINIPENGVFKEIYTAMVIYEEMHIEDGYL